MTSALKAPPEPNSDDEVDNDDGEEDLLTQTEEEGKLTECFYRVTRLNGWQQIKREINKWIWICFFRFGWNLL